MRIVHLSDIHLSKSNYQEFVNYYRDALIRDLHTFNNPKKIDIIVITGDLVDRGGHSLYEIDGYNDKKKYPSPYYIFEEVFITPIIHALNFPKENFLFIPGNHDVNESSILLKEESDLIKNINDSTITKYLNENLDLKHSQRLKDFKEFEYNFHKDNITYKFSNNQSTYIYNFNNINIGFLLVNDSWRCKSIKLKDEKDDWYVGIQQFYDGLNELKKENTFLNILLLHHATSNFIEKDDVEGFLIRNEIELMLYGHYHSDQTNIFYSSHGNCHCFRSKTSLSNPNETYNVYIPGYQVVDIDLIGYRIIEIHYKIFNSQPDAKTFIYDNKIGDNGIDKNKTNDFKGFKFYRDNRKSVQYSQMLDINLFKS